MSLTGVNRYVDTSATYNGDGTGPAQATSDGGAGAYNSIQSALSAAPNAPSTESERWLIWVRRLDIGSYSSITSTLSPTHSGNYNAPHMLIGFPFRAQQTGLTVDSVPTGTDNLGINKARWQFVDAALTEGDNYWMGAEVEFTSGSNNGLKRMVIWFDYSTNTIYLDFPLPNDIAASDQYTITLETEHYDDRPSEAQSSWDSDTNVTPVVDGGGGNFNIFYFSSYYHWQTHNFEIQNNGGSSYAGFRHSPKIATFLKLHDLGIPMWNDSNAWAVYLNKVFIWNVLSSYSGIYYGQKTIAENTHVLKQHSTYTSSGGTAFSIQRLKNCTFGRIGQLYYFLKSSGHEVRESIGENVLVDTSSYIVRLSNTYYDYNYSSYRFSGWQGETDKFRNFQDSGDVYNLDEDATINPPSGASTYVKFVPCPECCANRPLVLEEQHYQASGSKTYIWSFRPTGWAGLGTSDIEVEAWYLDETSGTHRNTSTANPATVTNDTWNNLTITINPDQAGTVYFEIKLKLYESGAYIALDPKVDIS